MHSITSCYHSISFTKSFYISATARSILKSTSRQAKSKGPLRVLCPSNSLTLLTPRLRQEMGIDDPATKSSPLTTEPFSLSYTAICKIATAGFSTTKVNLSLLKIGKKPLPGNGSVATRAGKSQVDEFRHQFKIFQSDRVKRSE